MLEASLAGGGSTSFSDIVSAADNLMNANPQELTLPGLPSGYPGMSLETIDFDTSDVIFGDQSSVGRNRRNSKASAEIELKTNTEDKNIPAAMQTVKSASNVTKGIELARFSNSIRELIGKFDF